MFASHLRSFNSIFSFLQVVNPATEKVITEVPCISTEETNSAIEAAAKAQKSWAAQTAGARSSVIEKWANSIEQNSSLLAELITMENVGPLRRTLPSNGNNTNSLSPVSGQS